MAETWKHARNAKVKKPHQPPLLLNTQLATKNLRIFAGARVTPDQTNEKKFLPRPQTDPKVATVAGGASGRGRGTTDALDGYSFQRTGC